MNRGSAAVRSLPLDRVRASMRPRFMNRGSHQARAGRHRPVSRFNEAPIHESGKSGPVDTDRSQPSGFNEAPIHESGK